MSNTYPNEGGDQTPRPEGASAPESLKHEVEAAREKLGEARSFVAEETGHLAEKMKAEASDKVEETTAAVSDALGVFADAIRKAGDELSGQDQSLAGKLASQAADGLQALSRSLGGKSPEEMLHAARDFGRDNPAAFLAGSVLAGVALGRFARSSGAAVPPAKVEPTGQALGADVRPSPTETRLEDQWNLGAENLTSPASGPRGEA